MRWLWILLLLLVPIRGEENRFPEPTQVARDLAEVGRKVDPTFCRNFSYRRQEKFLVVTFESILSRTGPAGIREFTWVGVTVVYRLGELGQWELVIHR